MVETTREMYSIALGSVFSITKLAFKLIKRVFSVFSVKTSQS